MTERRLASRIEAAYEAKNLTREFDTRIKLIEEAAKELISLPEEKDIPAINRNAKRMLASVKLLKIQIPDILDFGI